MIIHVICRCEPPCGRAAQKNEALFDLGKAIREKAIRERDELDEGDLVGGSEQAGNPQTRPLGRVGGSNAYSSATSGSPATVATTRASVSSGAHSSRKW